MKLVEENIDELLPVPEEIIEELVSENSDQTKQKEKTQKIYIDDLEYTVFGVTKDPADATWIVGIR